MGDNGWSDVCCWSEIMPSRLSRGKLSLGFMCIVTVASLGIFVISAAETRLSASDSSNLASAGMVSQENKAKNR